jgi:SecD/SecF fusion protein
MSQDTRTRFIITVILTVVLGYTILPLPNKPQVPFLKDAKINLGIDLAGGAELRYRVLYPEGFSGSKAEAIRTATDVIRRRIEAKQLAKEPKITSQGDDNIIVQIAGVDQEMLKDYRRLIETAGKLSLHAVAPRDIQEKFNLDHLEPTGWMAIDNDSDRRGSDSEYAAWAGAQILISRTPIILGSDISKSEPTSQLVPGGAEWVTSFELSQDGAKAFDEAAEKLYHQRPPGKIAIVLDGKLRSAPVVRSPSFHGHGTISGSRTQEEARDLSIILRSGSLPAPIGSTDQKPGERPRPESETFVGPTLGQDAIRRGLTASVLTLAVVTLFMIVYYRTAGFIAVLSLALNLIFLLGTMAFFNATLTLPGIAGLALTLGMAVDANILIYERIREEQEKGKSSTQAFEAGHDRAFTTIIDCHVTTMLSAVVLYYFGTGPVQGFAVTLAIGIATTLLSVLFCGKVFMKMALAGGMQEWKMMKFLTKPNIDFLRVAKACVIGTSAAALIGITFFGIQVKRGKALGIDFKGGTFLEFAMSKPVSIDEVRSRILGLKGPDGLQKYPDAEIQTVADPDATRAQGSLGAGTSRNFQLRTAFTDDAELRKDIQDLFRDSLSHEPFEEMPPSAVDKNPRKLDGRPEGVGWFVYVRQEKANLKEIAKKIAEPLSDPKRDVKLETNDRGEPLFSVEEVPGAPPGLTKLKICPTEKMSKEEEFLRRFREKLSLALRGEISQSPFLGQGKIGAAVASELWNSMITALIISWIGIIVYLAYRFEWRYGVAAVIALIHDALIAIAFTALAGAVVPKSWGLSFDMNMTTLAAILTIIGYSVNDTIVVFDRIRENLILMKKSTFPDIINASVNQTLSRTILTSFTVWITAVVLYVVTATTGGGIAEFSFPLIIGVLVGTYSSVYVAAPIVLWWYRGQKPAMK